MGQGRERVESVGYSQTTHSLRSSSASVDGGIQVPKRQKTRGGFSDLLTCPVCFETMFAPIYQCSKGHTVCCGCKAKVTSCPSCRGPLGDIRCLALEQAAELVDVPCRYQDHGCTMMVEYTAKKEHEETCKFRPFECISVGCQAEGTVPWLLTHLKAHPKISTYESAQITTNIVVSDKVGAYHPLVYSAHTQYFCLRMEMCKLMGPLVLAAWVQFMGESETGRSFRYSLEVTGNGRRILWEGVPRTIRESGEKIRNSHDCLIVRKNMVDFFSTKDKDDRAMLRLTGAIWKLK